MPGDAASIEIAKIQRDAMLGAASQEAAAKAAQAEKQQKATEAAAQSQAQSEAQRAASQLAGTQYAADRGYQGEQFKSNAGIIQAGMRPPPSATGYAERTGLMYPSSPGVGGSSGGGITSSPSLGGSTIGSPVKLGFAKGTARVPGKGDGKKDTVDAKLAPGEAVLNKPAAEGMGRGLIAALNAQGAKKLGMGMP